MEDHLGKLDLTVKVLASGIGAMRMTMGAGFG